MNVSDFQRKRSFIKTADFHCSYNNTQALMRNECGVHSSYMAMDMLTFEIREALSCSTLVKADAVMHPSVDIPKTGKTERKRSKRAAWMHHAAPTGQILSFFAAAKSFMYPLCLCLCVRQRIGTEVAVSCALPFRGLQFSSRNVKSP